MPADQYTSIIIFCTGVTVDEEGEVVQQEDIVEVEEGVVAVEEAVVVDSTDTAALTGLESNHLRRRTVQEDTTGDMR